MTGVYTLIRAQRCRSLKAKRKFSTTREKSAPIGVQSPVLDANLSGATVAEYLARTSAQSFLGSLSRAHTRSVDVASVDRGAYVKSEIAELLRSHCYDALLSTMTRWTSRRSKVSWKDVLDQRELAYIMSKLVGYQKDLLFKASTQKMMGLQGQTTGEMDMAGVREVREQIRAVYSNLLLEPGQEGAHLYSKSRGVLEKPSETNSTSYQFTATDYENMISLELNNGKLDLASRWFRRMELQHGSNRHYAYMTHGLWLLRFRVFGNAQSSLWRVERSVLNDVIVNPRQSPFKASVKWLDLFKEFMTHQRSSSGKSRCIFTNELVAVMLASIAHGRNVEQAEKLVEANWGITSQGQLLAGFEKPTPQSPLFPNIAVLTAVSVAMLYNQKYVACMSYINAFQHHYALDLGHESAKVFWDQLFRWAEIATKYSEARAFQYFVNETGSSAFAGSAVGLSDEFPVLLEEAKKSDNFDYAGYLKFVSDLRAQRVGLISELWKCFHESTPGFSARPYRTYLQLAHEYAQVSVVSSVVEGEQLCSDVCYDLLRHLLGELETYGVSPESFNASAVETKVMKIRELYVSTLKTLINAKGHAGRLGEIPHITAKWGLDEDMKQMLSQWAQRNENEYLEKLNQMEAKRLVDEDEDGFLDLL
ncbi:hypothetical protein JCM33374_g2273 [Metschnikowia sp. JCM 33374]|nr:hypothetical protein JCM33374_g2273 [Metschnikowia sp. JCM 33374]